ncbi:MAG: DUF370 domain-containing protein [Deltaproteobacteria bacterium]|jgi:regulator of extracellular matrix RemA (YlzA/DUF370 family)|nr:DUF370 domain-containing protein [Deltaproteobacteria bacterium]
MKAYLMDIGEGNYMAANQVLAVLRPGSSPGKKLRGLAKSDNRLVDATGGKGAKSLVVTVSNHLILSNQDPDELAKRLNEILDLPDDLV